MPQTRRIRMIVVAGGASLMVGCALAALGGSWMFYSAWPGAAGDGRGWMILPAAPLTAAAVLIAGAKWTRRVRPSIVESVLSLLALELIVLGIVAVLTGSLFMTTTFWFWEFVSLPFAPW